MKTHRLHHENTPGPRHSRILLSALLWPQLLLAFPGCVGEDGELGVDDGDGLQTEVGAKADCAATASSTVPIYLYSPSKQGQVRAALTAGGARFVERDFAAVLIDVEGASAASLSPVVANFLQDGKRVVLDSSGSPAARRTIGELAFSTAGLSAPAAALSIDRNSAQTFMVTEINLAPSFAASDSGLGNTPLALLADPDSSQVASCEAATSELTAAAAETTTRRKFQSRSQPAPAIVRYLYDNKTSYPRLNFVGSNYRRYLYVGDIQRCSSSQGNSGCEFSWGQSYTKEVSHGTSVSVKFGGKLAEAVTGEVELGYSLTLTNSRTLSWSNTHLIQRGYSARPVSYVIRQNGTGNVKNAFVWKNRTSVHSPCRPSGGCYWHTDHYTREPNTVVGTWTAEIVLNGGATTNTWMVFRGNVDPNGYTMEKRARL